MVRLIHVRPLPLSSLLLLAGATIALGQFGPPSGYYDGTSDLTGSALKDALHDIIDNHDVIPYTSSSTDVWDALKLLDRDPEDSESVLLIYSGETRPVDDTNGNGNPGITSDSWEREHLWPRSYGIASNGADSSDLFNLRACRRSVNSSRANRIYAEPSPLVAQNPPFCPECLYDRVFEEGGLWSARPSERGDIARSMFYMAVRYDGSDSNTTDLEISNSPSDVLSLFGELETLLMWHIEDPVDQEERRRNHLIYTDYQGNRNPFVDHPNWVSDIFGSVTPSILLTLSSNSVPESSGSIFATIDLTEAPDSDLTITIEKIGDSDNSEIFLPLSVTVPADMTFGSFTITILEDGVLDGDQAIEIIASAADYLTDQETLTVIDEDVPVGASSELWINEFHYDDTNTDNDEFIEVILGPGVTNSLSDIVVYLYNGNGGRFYDSFPLTEFTEASPANGYSIFFLDLPTNGIQNGAPDGIALVVGGTVVEFLSYEGTFSATDGPANGLQSTDIEVEETGTTAEGSSLERRGTGQGPDDFSWYVRDGTNSKGSVNLDQTLINNALSELEEYLSSFGVPESEWDPTVDSDNDGYTQLEEFMFNGHPLESSALLTLLPTAADEGLKVSFDRRKNTAFATIAVEINPDLSDPSGWTETGVQQSGSAVPVNDDYETVTFETTATISEADALFLRLFITESQ